MINASLITAAIMTMASEQLIGAPEAKTPKTKTGYPTDAYFARMDKAQAKRNRKAERNLRNLKNV